MNTQFVFEPKQLKRYKFPTHINDLVIDRKYSSFSEVFMVEIEPLKSVPHHKHDDTEQIFYMLEGTGILSIGEEKKEFQVKPGDVIRVPVSTYHFIRPDSERTIKYLSIDCFGFDKPSEPTWDDHVAVICKANGWEYNKVITSGY